MSTDHRIIVMRILDQVQDGLSQYVLMKYRQRYADERLKKLVENVRGQESFRGPLLESDDELLRSFDVASWLKAVTRGKDVFRDELGPPPPGEYRDFNRVNAFNFVYELLHTRNVFAHSSARDQFEIDGVYRVAENATRLLLVVGAKSEAQAAEKILRSVGKRIYGARGDSAEKKLMVVEKELAVAKQKVADLQKTLKSARRSEATSKNRVDNLTKRLTTAENKVSAYTKKLGTAEAELKVARRDAQSAEKELADVKKKLRSAERQLTTIEKELAEYRNSAPQLSSIANDKHSKHFAGENLSGRNLSGKDLSRANLANASLRGANLTGAVLRDTDLAGADLTNTVLIRADFTGANLSNAQLQNADLSDANMKNATLRRARLMGAKLQGAVLPDGKKWTQSSNMGSFLK